ncbi:MAG TPA: protein kinase [Thermoanaerobaculia bacterium]|nr:protein kinase [Thermoanaerobaculia bacterium]
MQIAAGTRFGQYQIVARLGAGGMGEVYRARDTRLGRDVAVKALSAAVAHDASRLSRFETEARSASALNHPNIVTIHEVGHDAAGPFIVMELVDGRTLRELLHAGALPVRKALHVAAQLADALARAHDAGIVHRDLKPENVMVNRDGFAKILDFGLARIESTRDARGTPDREDLTLTEEARGTVVGTAGYMSPEQASGQAVDCRSDQFAFGALVYEMLSGKRAFQRGTRAETLAAIIRDEPEALAVLCPRAPVPLLWIVERCLAKLPEERYAATRDLSRDLASVRDHFSQIDSGAEGAPLPLKAEPRRARRSLSAGVAVAFAALVASAYLLGTSARVPSPPSFQRLTFRDGTIWSARFAPDGRTIVYGAAWNGGPIRSYTTRPETPESAELPVPPSNLLAISSAGELALQLSPRTDAPFSTRGTLARAPLAGGAPRETLEGVEAADFAPDGASLAVVRAAGDGLRLEFPPGRVRYETATGALGDVRVSPGGDLVAFVEHPVRDDDAGDVAVVDRDGPRRTLSAGWCSVRGLAWSPDGGEIWFTAAVSGGSRALYAVTLGGHRRLVARVPGSLTLHDISREGRVLLSEEHAREGMMARLAGEAKARDISWHDRSHPVDVADDGGTVLFDETGEGGGAACAVYVRKAGEAAAVRLGEGHALALSPDGKWALSADPASPGELVLLPTGAGEPRRVRTAAFAHIERAAWLPDGERLVLAASLPGRRTRLYVQPVSGGAPRPITAEGLFEDWTVSPDGASVAAAEPDRGPVLYPLGGGDGVALPGGDAGDAPIRFTADGRGLFVAAAGDGDATAIARIDLAAGRREPWATLASAEGANRGARRVFLSADGRAYVSSYERLLDELFLVDGLR